MSRETILKIINSFLTYYAVSSVMEEFFSFENWIKIITALKDVTDFAFSFIITYLSSLSGLPPVFISFLLFVSIFYALVKLLGMYIKKFLIASWVIFGSSIGLKLLFTFLL